MSPKGVKPEIQFQVSAGFKAVIIGAIIGGLVGSVITGIWTDHNNQEMLKNQVKSDQKFIAIGLLSEINQIEVDNQKNADAYNSYLISNDESKLKLIRVSVTPIYPDTGLYYLYGKDIFKFEGGLSEKLYDYYFNVLTYEQDRKIIIEEFYNKDISQMDQQSQKKYDTVMKDYCSRSKRIAELSSEIKPELEKYKK